MKKGTRGDASDAYRREALDQIPRLLSLMDRNPFSKTYGCADRTYWLDKAIDFPSAIMQYSVHSLALVYANDFEGNIYYRQPKIKEWILASIKYWSSIQKNDGSYDEFYPNERGWAGPTGFLLYAMLASYELVGEEFPSEMKSEFFGTCKKAALFLAKYDEHGILANHHAMALLPLYYAAHVLHDDSLLYNFNEKLDFFLGLQSNEGWFLEYDGADLGYLSASISFLTKLLKIMEINGTHTEWKTKIEASIPPAIAFASHFVYPNGYYGGTMGSRQTLHFYPHGFEVWATKNEHAAAVADWMAEGLANGTLVPPRIMPDRYVAYRVNEFLQSFLDAFPRGKIKRGTLPWQGEPFHTYFSHARMVVRKTKSYYAVVNLAKGGVIKAFDLHTNHLLLNDCGIMLTDTEGMVSTTQWIDDAYTCTDHENKSQVTGLMHKWANELPTPLKMMALRSALITLGSNTDMAYSIKGKIRERIILQNKALPLSFNRKIIWKENEFSVTDEINSESYPQSFLNGKKGDEFSIRYVPQSLYFQAQELGVSGKMLTIEQITELNDRKKMSITETVTVKSKKKNDKPKRGENE